MKSSALNARYFSAYPLKAVEAEMQKPSSNPPQSPYLRSLLAGNKKSAGTLRVYPMANPYKDHPEPVALRTQPPPIVFQDSKEWFCDYE
jgi:hypothetical protein